jgi:hypothetical protein
MENEADSKRILDRVKCTKQFVQSAARNAKFHLSRLATDQSFAKNATKTRNLKGFSSLAQMA